MTAVEAPKAGAKSPQVWPLSIPEKEVEVYRNPAGDQFVKMAVYRAGEKLSSSAVTSFSIELNTLFTGTG
jgi:hypothetical protein